ncbi:MAG TPA: M90 family metallopeptidase [Steroidobacteraceae bacterium]
MLLAALFAAAFAVLAALVLPPVLRARSRRRLQRMALPDAVRDVIDRRLPIRARLPPPLRRRHDGLINAFLAEKRYTGCNGLVIDDEIRATIAAQACLLLLGREGSLYDELRSILVYPSAFWVEDEVHDDDGLVTRRRRMLSGESWDAHRIVLSWEDIADSVATPDDGFNLVLHEFAHYLEAEGRGLPSPPLPYTGEVDRARDRVRVRTRSIDAWADDLADEFDALIAQVDRGEETFLDPYAAEDEAEFFAVATEDFYERSSSLQAAHPRLYRLLREFYGVDPAIWSDPR